METFKTNPESYTVEGNIIGVRLGLLTNLEDFVLSHSTVTAEDPENIEGRSFNVIKLAYEEEE